MQSITRQIWLSSLCWSPLLLSLSFLCTLSFATETYLTPFLNFDHEVLRVENLADEDVIYIRARGETSDSCGSDCATYSAWDWSVEETEEKKQDESEDITPLAIRGFVQNISASTLHERALPKSGEICPDKIPVSTYIYPSNDKVEKTSQVFDFKSPVSPNDEGFFEFGNVKKRSKDLDHDGNSRGYAVEHILEWHLLKNFLDGTDDKGSGTRCEVFAKYWAKYMVEIDTTIETHSPGTAMLQQVKKKLTENNALAWITHQIPGTKRFSDWEYEFVVLQSDINGKKMSLWTSEQKSMSPQPEILNGLISETNMSNNKTMEWQLENKYFTKESNPKKEMRYYPNNEGYLMAIKRFRDVMGLYEYHRTPLIQKYLWAQITRIGTAFEYLEKDVLLKVDWKSKQIEDYKYQGLKAQWEEYMSDRFKESIAKIEDWMELHKPGIKKLAEGKRKRSFWESIKRAPPTKKQKPNAKTCATSTNDEVKDRAKMLIEAYEKMPKDWKNPFD